MGRIKRGYVREIPDDELKRDYRLFAIDTGAMTITKLFKSNAQLNGLVNTYRTFKLY